MAKGSIATAWIQVLPSLEGLQSALVKASKGAVLTPAVQPKLASGTSRLFASHGLGMSKLFSGSFNKSLNLQGGVKGALNGVFASFGSGGRRSANAFGNGFANLDLGKYLNAAAAVAAVASVGKAVKTVTSNIVEMGNQWGQTTAMLKNAVGTTGDYKDSLETSLEYANKVGVTTDDFIQSAARLRTLAPEVVTNYGDAARFTKLLDMNMISTGASTQEASSAMRQITQALGKGIVNGDELNSIMENSPQIARMLAKHLNASVGDLKQLGKEGSISGQALYDTVLENADAIEQQFSTMPVTADRAWNSIKNTVGARSEEAATALSANLGKTLTAISNSGMVDMFGEMLAGFVPLSNATATLASTFVNQLAPAVNKAFNVQQVEQFLSPLTNLISLNSQNANLLSSFGDALNTVGVIGTAVFSLMVATNDRFASRIPFIGRALVNVKDTLIELGSSFTSAFGAAVSASSAVIDKLASMSAVMAKTLSESTRVQNALGKFNVAFEDLGTYAFSFGEKGAEGFETVQQAAMNLRNGVGQASENVKLLQAGLNAMGSDADALPESFLKAFETLNTEVDAAARKKAPSLIQAFHDIRAAADTIVVDSDIYRSLDTAGQSADIYRDKLVQVGREFKDLTGLNIPDMFLPLVGSAVSASDSIMQTFGNLKTGLSNYFANTAQQWAPVKEIFAEAFSNAAASVKTKMEAMRADVESGVSSMVDSVKGKASEFKTAFAEMLDTTGIGETMSKIGAVVGNGLSTVKAALESFGSEAASTLAMPFNGLPEKIFGSFKGQNPFAPLTSAAKTLGAGLSATVGGAVSRLAGRFSPLASAGKAAFATIGSAALKVSSGALKGFGAAVNGVGKEIGKIGGIASQLGVTGAIFTGLTAGFQTLFKLDPSQMTGKFDEWQKSLDNTLTGIQTKLPAMASAFAAALPQMVASVTAALPNIANALMSVGQTLAPALMTILPQITQAFSDMFAQLPSFIATYGQPMLEAFGTLFATLAGQIPSLMTSLGQALVAGVQAAFSAVSANSAEVAGFISGFGASLASGLQTLGATVVAALPSIGQSIASALPTLIPALMSAITSVITSLAAALPGIAVAIIQQLPAIIGGLVTGIINGLPTLLGAFVSVVGSIAANFPSIFMAVVGAVPAIIGNIARPFAGLGGRILGFIKNIPGKIMDLFADAGSWLVNSGEALMNGLKQGILGAVESVKKAVSGALQKVRDFFPFSPAKVGPFSGSGYTSVSGEHLMRDFGKAIGAQGAFVRGQVDDVLGSLDFDQIDATNLGMVSAPQLKDYTGMVSAGDQRYAGGVHIDNVVASPLSDVELVARRFGYALNNEMIGSVRP
uniref:Tail tape measure n=1 Tax=Siphoviridae sp. ctICF6 TaxID=2825427 RepID=A0A8S5UKY9_9CAUD|nr:MAG TPA: Tail tape measure [Siphoviridae sp. ctICF6]